MQVGVFSLFFSSFSSRISQPTKQFHISVCESEKRDRGAQTVRVSMFFINKAVHTVLYLSVSPANRHREFEARLERAALARRRRSVTPLGGRSAHARVGGGGLSVRPAQCALLALSAAALGARRWACGQWGGACASVGPLHRETAWLGGTQGGLNCLTHAPRCLPTPNKRRMGTGKS